MAILYIGLGFAMISGISAMMQIGNNVNNLMLLSTFKQNNYYESSLPSYDRRILDILNNYSGSAEEVCSNVKASDYAGEKFLLEYDGQEIQGIPGFDVCTDDLCQGFSYYTRVVNLKDGTELTDTKGNTYVFLASGVSSAFQPAAGGLADCSAIAFTSLTDLGIPASDLPSTVDRSSTDYPLPSSVWTDAPTTSSCTVTMGDTSNCN